MMPANNANTASKIVVIYAAREVQRDGTITLRPIKVVDPEEDIEIPEMVKIARKSARQLAHLCEIGVFKTAYKLANGRTSPWRVNRVEFLQHFLPSPE